MGTVATTSDPNWPSAATLLSERPVEGRRNVGLLGISTFATSVTARSATSTPAAIRSRPRALLHLVVQRGDRPRGITCALVDFGDVDSPDAAGGAERVADALARWDPQHRAAPDLGR